MTETGGRARRGRKPPVDLELELVDWGARGSALAEHAGRTVLIDRGIPGETVTATVDRRKRPWRGVANEAPKSSPRRVSPPCPYYVRGCGGCQWQHMVYEFQLGTKRALVD